MLSPAVSPPATRRRRAFTLIELIVVVIIIAILAAIAGVAYNTFVDHARDTALTADAKQTDLAITAKSAQDDKTPSAEVAAAFASGTGVVDAAAASSTAFASYFSINYDVAHPLVFTPDSATSPTTVTVALGSRAECLTLGTEAGMSSTITSGACAVGAQQPSTPTPTNGATTGASSGSTMAFAGSAGVSGYAEGTGTAAQFWTPKGVAVDGSGNVYVADQNNDRIFKITPAGVTTTFAGNGNLGSANGTGTAAEFDYPSGVAVDAAGNVYVADQYNNQIRKITPTGAVSLLAGDPNGYAGSRNGTGSAAQFFYPVGVAVDGSGNVYVADLVNGAIRKIAPSGVVTTFAGGLSDPIGVAVDGSGNVYVAEAKGNRISKFTPAGVETTFAGSGVAGTADGAGSTAQFHYPTGVAVDGAGNVYVADQGNNQIRKVTPAGNVSTLAGSGTAGYAEGTGPAAEFNGPFGVGVDAAGNVYVADTGNHLVRKINK